MKPHIHAGVMTGLATFGMVIIAGTLWRLVAYRMVENNPDSALGKAMQIAY